MILCQSSKVTHTRRKVKGQNGCRRHGHGKEGTALEPLGLWTSSIYELFFIELRLSAAKVWHVGQSWTEAIQSFLTLREAKWTYSCVFQALSCQAESTKKFIKTNL